MKQISLLHPFSAKAIGLNEKDLYFSHSQPHEKALREIQSKCIKISIDYFTGNVLPYSIEIEGVKKQFWPVTCFFRAKHRWRKQYSVIHYLKNIFMPSDLTIINMSGHGSKYIFKLSKILKQKKKSYIAMIGGMHMSFTGEALKYYQSAHHLIVHTSIQKKQLLRLSGFEKLDIRILPLGIDTDLFKPSLKSKIDKLSLLYVGRISRLKQIELAINTCMYLINNQTREVILTIIGPISDKNYYSELKLLVNKLNLTKNVIFIDNINQKDLIPYYQQASLLLLPSTHESFGMVMVEAMACATPVAALRGAGGPDEIIEDGINGLLCSKEDYSSRIFEFVNSDNIQKYMQSQCRKIVIDKWSLFHTTECFRSSIECALNYK